MQRASTRPSSAPRRWKPWRGTKYRTSTRCSHTLRTSPCSRSSALQSFVGNEALAAALPHLLATDCHTNGFAQRLMVGCVLVCLCGPLHGVLGVCRSYSDDGTAPNDGGEAVVRGARILRLASLPPSCVCVRCSVFSVRCSVFGGQCSVFSVRCSVLIGSRSHPPARLSAPPNVQQSTLPKKTP